MVATGSAPPFRSTPRLRSRKFTAISPSRPSTLNRRSIVSDTRDAVTTADRPEGKRKRATAKSGWSETTRAPVACTSAGSSPASVSTRSMSWIIRSSTTDTSRLRGRNGAARTASHDSAASRPGASTTARKAAEKRSIWPTCSTLPCLAARAARASASASVAAMGFSMNRCRPASSTAVPSATWKRVGAATITASASAMASARPMAGAPASAATAAARAASAS